MCPLTAGIFGPQQGGLSSGVPHVGDTAIGSSCSITTRLRDAYFAWCSSIPHLHAPGLSETRVAAAGTAAVAEVQPVPSRLIFLIGLPHPHLVWSFGSILHVQVGPQVQAERGVALGEDNVAADHFLAAEGALAGFQGHLLHLHSGPQSHQ